MLHAAALAEKSPSAAALYARTCRGRHKCQVTDGHVQYAMLGRNLAVVRVDVRSDYVAMALFMLSAFHTDQKRRHIQKGRSARQEKNVLLLRHVPIGCATAR